MGTHLIDSNAVIDYLSGLLPPKGMQFLDEVVDAIPQVSVITQIEVLGHSIPLDTQDLLSDFMGDSVILPLTEDVVNQTIELRKRHKIKIPDAIIAATALVNNLVLISRNKHDFKNIEGLTVIDPHSI